MDIKQSKLDDDTLFYISQFSLEIYKKMCAIPSVAKRYLKEPSHYEALITTRTFKDRKESRVGKSLHRKKGPAVEFLNGDKKHYIKGILHRDNGPAIEVKGIKKWYRRGKLHRLDGPAIEYPDGIKEWYSNGRVHRKDGPAIEYPNGDYAWILDGYLHRKDGPAVKLSESTIKNGIGLRNMCKDKKSEIIFNSGEYWFIDGKRVVI